MKQVTHYNKVMWGLFCEYSYIPAKVWYTEKNKYEWYTDEDGESQRRIVGSYPVKHVERSSAQWSFIHSKYYYVTKIDPIYGGELGDFISYIDPAEYNSYSLRRRNPYIYKKNQWNPYSHQCGKNTYRWRYTSGKAQKYQKLSHHEKKELSEETIKKREWRKKVKDPRNQGSRYYSGSHRKVACKIGNRTERRETKSQMKSTKWEYYPKSSIYWETSDCTCECCYNYRDMQWDYNYPENEWDKYFNKTKRYWVDPWDWS